MHAFPKKQGLYDPALEALLTAQHYHPEYLLTYVNLSGIYIKLSQYDEAELYLHKAIGLQPDQPELRRHLGELYLSTQRYAQALAQ